MRRPFRLLSIAHSYCVALNRRLAHEMALVGGNQWEVVAVAPSFFHGDLRPVALEIIQDEACELRPVRANFTKQIHVMLYGRGLRETLREGWDIIHCWEEPYIFAGGQVAKWSPQNTALVYATFQNIAKQYTPPFNWIERYSLSRASGWIAFGQTVAETLVERASYSAIDCRVIPPGVDLNLFRPDSRARLRMRQQLNWDESEVPVVGYLGRFVEEKGVRMLTRVLERIRSPWRALFVGAGPLDKELQTWARAFGERVRVITGVRHEQVPHFLNAMDVLCAPSQTTSRWREQLGRMLIEAFACGVPVLASDSGEIPHVVIDAGLIVSEKDEATWAETLACLLENRSQRSQLSERGLERAHTVYAWPVVARKHLDFFDQILDSRQKG